MKVYLPVVFWDPKPTMLREVSVLVCPGGGGEGGGHKAVLFRLAKFLLEALYPLKVIKQIITPWYP